MELTNGNNRRNTPKDFMKEGGHNKTDKTAINPYTLLERVTVCVMGEWEWVRGVMGESRRG